MSIDYKTFCSDELIMAQIIKETKQMLPLRKALSSQSREDSSYKEKIYVNLA